MSWRSQSVDSIVIASGTDPSFDEGGLTRQRLEAAQRDRQLASRRLGEAALCRGDQLCQDQSDRLQARCPPRRNAHGVRRARRMVSRVADLAVEIQRGRPGPDPHAEERIGQETREMRK